MHHRTPLVRINFNSFIEAPYMHNSMIFGDLTITLEKSPVPAKQSLPLLLPPAPDKYYCTV
jgi:hypothetical protein